MWRMHMPYDLKQLTHSLYCTLGTNNIVNQLYANKNQFKIKIEINKMNDTNYLEGVN